MKLNLSQEERQQLRKKKVKQASLLDYNVEELQALLQGTTTRAKELHALIEFQQISSVGIKFAQDLIFLGYYSLAELKGKDGAELTNAYEQKKGYQTDPCVEDQFRLAVYVAQSDDFSKNWWNFTAERKAFRSVSGYPNSRPSTHWTAIYQEKN